MTNKIAIALCAVIVLAVIIPTAYAQQRDVSKDTFDNKCINNILVDDKKQFNEFQCIYFPEIWNWINELFDITSSLETGLINTIAKTDDLQYRLDVLDGKIPAPALPLTLNVYPKSISEGEQFRIYGTANMMEQSWVDLQSFNPDGVRVQYEYYNLKLNNVYASLLIEPNHKWTISGNYTVIAFHNNENVTAYIQYNLGE